VVLFYCGLLVLGLFVGLSLAEVTRENIAYYWDCLSVGLFWLHHIQSLAFEPIGGFS
jgi:hypothetical protein